MIMNNSEFKDYLHHLFSEPGQVRLLPDTPAQTTSVPKDESGF